MDKIAFGAFWTIFTCVVFGIFLSTGQFNLGIILFFLLFLAVGLFVLYLGLKKVFKDSKTNSKGELCYGVITDISPDEGGVQVNGRAQSKVTVQFFVESLNTMKTLSENIGFKEDEYSIGSCVRIKYYDGDINIVEKYVDINQVPVNIQNYLRGLMQNSVVPNGMYTGDESTITINGVTYRKEDNTNEKVQ